MDELAEAVRYYCGVVNRLIDERQAARGAVRTSTFLHEYVLGQAYKINSEFGEAFHALRISEREIADERSTRSPIRGSSSPRSPFRPTPAERLYPRRMSQMSSSQNRGRK